MKFANSTIRILALLLGLTLASAYVVAGSKPQSKTMNTFALLFTAGSKELSESDLKLRAQLVKAWVKKQNGAGHHLEPRAFGPEHVEINSEAKIVSRSQTSEGHLTIALFVEAKDFDEAVALAQSHPGLKFGSKVEVRSWSQPVPIK